MTFATPALAVAGVLAVAIPIIIFLMWRQRRTPVPWAAMRFLMEAYRKHRRRLRVEQILLLAVRCLVLALLGLALARPLLESASLPGTGRGRVVYLVVDDGLASAARRDADRTALDASVDDAVRLVEALEVGDRVGVVTAARPARAVLSPPSSDHGAVVDLLRDLRPSAAPTDVPGALDRLREALASLGADHDRTFVYLLSEFRAGSAALEEALPAAVPPDLPGGAGRVVLLAAPAAAEPISNVQVTAVTPARRVVLPGALDGSGQVTVRLARQGGELEREVTRVRLAGDAVTHVEPKVVTWTPGQSEATAEFMLEFTSPGERETGISALIDGDALDADNERHTVLEVRRQIRVVLLDRHSFGFEPTLDRLSAGRWIGRALAPTDDGPVEVVLVDPAALDLADLRTADAAVLPRPDLLAAEGWDTLRSFLDRGGLVVIAPPAELRVHQWTDRLREKIGLRWAVGREIRELQSMGLAAEQPATALLRMVSSDLTALASPVVVDRVLPVTAPQAEGEVVLRLADGTPFLLAGSPAGAEADDAAQTDERGPRRSPGLVVLLTTAPELDWTNLPARPFMVPLFHEILRQGLTLIRSTGDIRIGDRPPLLVGPAASRLAGPDGGEVALDGAGRPERAFEMPGLYRVVDRAAQEIGSVAVNVEPAAARTDTQPASAVAAWLGRSGPWEVFDRDDLGAAFRSASGGSPLAGILLVGVLLLVLAETLLARWFSHADRAGGARPSALRPTMSGRDRAPHGLGGAM